MSKRRILRNSIFNENVEDSNFENQPSSTVFRLGSFTLDTNLENRIIGDFSNKITTFSKEYTLDTININDTISNIIYKTNTTVSLNIDYKNITSYARYGSLEDLFKFSVKNIIEKYPYSLFMASQLNTGLVNTIFNFSYNELEDISTFVIPTISIINISNIIVDSNNNIPNENNELKNLNLNLDKYIISDLINTDIEYSIIGFTGNTKTDNYITLEVKGKLFNLTNSSLSKDFHIRPSNEEFNKFLHNISDIERYFLSNKIKDGYSIGLKALNKDGRTFNPRNLLWPVNDGYNINIDGNSYIVFLNELIKIGKVYDEFKTDTIYRLYTTNSLKEFDITNTKKINKLLRTYGFEFDKIKRLIDGFATLSNLTYKKENSIPDILVKNLAKVLGWEVFDIVKEEDLLKNIFTVKTNEISNSIIPSEIDIELWRRIILNTKWFLKSKGTRKSIETIFKLIGVPEQFIDLKEYIYLAERKLDISDRKLSTKQSDLFDDLIITNQSSFNDDGYPIAVNENSNFFFQISGNTDSGQAYLNRFRENGFEIKDVVDNKKSWLPTSNFELRHNEDSLYELNDSNLIINTKEIDMGFNPSKALENDVYQFNKATNFPICDNNVATGIIYVNTPLNPNSSQQTIFEIPDIPEGHIQVSINGITLTLDEDYFITGETNNIVILSESAINEFNGVKDIVTITYVTDLISENRNIVEYVIVKININQDGQSIITLPDEPLGDLQLVLNGITLKNGTNLINGDFYINPLNRTEIIIISEDVNSELKTTDILSIMYLKEVNDNNIKKYSDSHIITSFFASKLYYNNIINRYVYITDYKILNQSSIKVTFNGTTLNHGLDFILSSNNKNQIIFSPNVVLRINDIINCFYLIEDDISNECITLCIDNGIDSFLGYTDNLIKNLINTKNRKIISNNDGGLYPKLSLIYDIYLKKYNDNFSFTNGFKYNELYSYIKRFDGHFNKFLFELLPATTILRRGGLIVSNSIFSRQKYKYIRGINDGSEFIAETQKLTCDLLDFTVQTTPVKSISDLGSITISGTGFNEFVEYSIDGGEFYFVDNIFNNLNTGEYNISLKDSIGCIVTGTTEIGIDCSDFNLNEIQVTNIISDTQLGTIEIIASGDTNIYYSIDNGFTYVLNNNLFTNLSEGEYTIVIKNSIDCIITGSTVNISNNCDSSITEFEYGICEATGFLNRTGSTLSVVNDILALNLIYNFTIDNQFVRYFKEKITITETNTDHTLLEKWVEFEINPGVTSINLGNIFIYNVPTYQSFIFEDTYSGQTISCSEFVEELPDDVFEPLPDAPPITITAAALVGSTQYMLDGFYEIELFGNVNIVLSQNLTLFIKLLYVDNGVEGFILSSIVIPAGDLNRTVASSYQSTTTLDSVLFGEICITSIDYTGPEIINLLNECIE